MKSVLKLFLLLIVSIQILNATLIELTIKEKQFIKNHPTITLGTDKGWEPYTIENTDGSITGYDADVLRLINNITGANFILKRGRWNELTQEVKDKKIEGLSTGVINETQKKYLVFSKPYLILTKMIFINSKNKKSIKSVNDLKGKTFAVNKNNPESIRIANNIKGIKLLKLDNTKKIINAVTTGQADAMLGNAAMVYILTKQGNPYLIPSIILDDKPLELVFSIRKDLHIATSIINKALNNIGEQKLLERKQYWFKITSNSKLKPNTLKFTNPENKYIHKIDNITMCVSPSWMPFEMIDEQGKYKGVGADIIKIISKKIDKPIVLIPTTSWSQTIKNFKDKKCDILPLAVKTPSRQKIMNFTKPFITNSLVVVTKEDKFFIQDSRELQNKKIGIVNDYAYIELLKQKYPNINIVTVKNITEGLKKVQNGEIFGFVDSLSSVAYIIQKEGMTNIKIAGRLEFDVKLSIASQKNEPLLNTIMQKALDDIGSEQIDTIIGKWISIKVEQSFDYRKLIYITIVFLIIVLLLMYRQNTISKMNKKLEELSITDNLTKLYNRNKLDEVLITQSNNSNRFSNTFGIIIIDIDYFKKVNDTYGHQMGDTVLKEFAQIIKTNSRQTDTVGRWGGEEFMIICSETQLEGIVTLAQNLRQQIESYSFSIKEQKTASFGVSIYKKDEKIENMVKRADDALYNAKENGRNKVESL